MSVYIVVSDRALSAFYHADGGVVRRVFDGRWGKAEVVSRNGSGDFFIAEQDGDLRLLSRESGGAFLRLEEDGWRGEKIFEAEGVTDLSFIRRGGEFRFFGVSGDFLVTKVGNSAFERVGRLTGGYRLQNVTSGHGLVFFGAYSPELTIGYREFNLDEIGGFRPLYAAGAAGAAWSLGDRSFLTTDAAVHSLFVLKGLFTKRLLYRKKTSEGLTAPALIRESPRLDGCLLYLSNGRLHAAFTESALAYEAVSEDNGTTFTTPALYPRKFSPYPAKATLLLVGERASKAAFFARETFTDANHPLDILQIPEVWEDFYPSFSPTRADDDATKETTRTDPKKEEPADMYDPFAGMKF